MLKRQKKMFIKKIFQNQVDENVHRQFVRFGKGTFPGRAAIKITRQPEKIKIGTSFELSSDVAEFVAEISNSTFSGIVMSKEDIKPIFEKNGLDIIGTKKLGLLVYNVENINSKVILEIKDKAYTFLLDAQGPGIFLSSKKKLPKPGKSGDAKIDDKFCQLELDTKFWPQVKSEFAFDLPDFKKALAVHTYTITDIIMPKGEKDFEKIRLLAKRKGKIIRKITIDGKEIVKEKDFEA